MALFSEPVVVAGRDRLLGQNEDVKWADVTGAYWILPHPNAVARQAVDALSAATGPAPPGNRIASLSLALDIEHFRAMAASGLWQHRLAQAQTARGDPVTLPVDARDLRSDARCILRLARWRVRWLI